MQAITVRDRDAGVGGLTLTDLPYPHAAENDVIVRVHAAGFTPGELEWPATWTDRAGRDRTPSVPGHELSGVVVELGYGTTGLTVGQRVFGLTDWSRNGSLAEYTAVEARNLAPLAADIDHTVAAALPISGLTAWQGLFVHAGLTTGQTVLIHGAAGGVGSIAVQLAREVGAQVIGTGRTDDRDVVLGLGAQAFLDLDADALGGRRRSRRGLRRHRRRRPRAVNRAGAPRRHPRDHRHATYGAAQGRARRLLRGRTRPRAACGPGPAIAGRAAEAHRRRRAPPHRDGRRVCPPPTHSRQDDHPGSKRPRRRTSMIRAAIANRPADHRGRCRGRRLRSCGRASGRHCSHTRPSLSPTPWPPVRASGRPSAHPSETLAPLFEQVLPNVPGKTFTSAIVTFPPAARAVPHRHGDAFVYAYVLEGTVSSQLEGEPAHVYHQGENWSEPPGAHHLATENTSPTEPAKLLVVFIATTGEQLKVDDPHR